MRETEDGGKQIDRNVKKGAREWHWWSRNCERWMEKHARTRLPDGKRKRDEKWKRGQLSY